ncbi:MAG: hypothetical protein JEZ11_16520, partial [Desulfobacterales bacterium]|nr:hypothetical protein [Desulfobacterales bacterium]
MGLSQISRPTSQIADPRSDKAINGPDDQRSKYFIRRDVMSKTMKTIDGNTAAAHVAYAMSDVANIYP